jgi:hypothetical protein
MQRMNQKTLAGVRLRNTPIASACSARYSRELLVWLAGEETDMDPLHSVRLSNLMELGPGREAIKIGLIDGPVALNHPDLAKH